jgi:hypothetical protein
MERPGPFRSYQGMGDPRWRGWSHISGVRGLLANPGNLASEWLRGRADRRSFMVVVRSGVPAVRGPAVGGPSATNEVTDSDDCVGEVEERIPSRGSAGSGPSCTSASGETPMMIDRQLVVGAAGKPTA